MNKLFTSGLLSASLVVSWCAAAAPSPNQDSAFGINLNGVSYWSTQWALLDVMKHASNGTGALWSTTNADTYAGNTGHQERLQLDDQGWPMTLPARNDPDFHYVTTVIYQDNPHYSVGEYSILYDGEGELAYSGVTLLPEKSQPGHDVVELEADSFFHIQIRRTDPNQTGNYLRNIRVIVPGGLCGSAPTAYAEHAAQCETEEDFVPFEQIYQEQPFHPLFLKDLENYRSLRYMQALRTNVSELSNWQDRAPADYATWGTSLGIPYEMAVELSNWTLAEPWINVPARADDNYMLQLARLLKESLDPQLHIHVELGNEVWNSAYPYVLDANWMEQQGREVWPEAGVSAYEYRLNYFGRRSAEMCQIFKQEFGDQAERIDCVMGGFVAGAWTNEQILACPLWAAENNDQTCGSQMDSLAIGPYFGGYLHHDRYLDVWLGLLNDDPSATMDFLFEEIFQGGLRDLTYDPELPDWSQAPVDGSLASVRQHVQENERVAEQYNLKLTAYEGGQHLTFAGNMADGREQINEQLFLAANRDERMGQAFTQHFDDWRQAGGTLYMVFEGTGRWGRFGAFPIKEYQLQPSSETPKLNATQAYISDYPCWWESCQRTTQTGEPEPGEQPEPIPEPTPEPDSQPAPEPSDEENTGTEAESENGSGVGSASTNLLTGLFILLLARRWRRAHVLDSPKVLHRCA